MAEIVLSAPEAQRLLDAHRRGQTRLQASPDLNRSRVTVQLLKDGVLWPDGQRTPWEHLQTVAEHSNAVFVLTPQGPEPIRAYSPLTERVVALYPTSRAPTVLLSGIPMHRVQGTDPWRDTQAKVRALRPRGWVLDTCMGLGYSALQAAATADRVLTVEIDPAVLEVARRNPWSQPVFQHPRVHIVQADVATLIQSLPSGFFSAILHDPPQFALAGELYGQDFYAELFRVLKPGGRLFHYVGSPSTRMGRNMTRGVARRLQAVGFERIRPVPRAFGILAQRPRT
ncbi:MAG: methyltransferase domain-containing protein [Chloroflexi bacterium]|nr:methyltransferase domain-containing protein [Chloroflexota bacterium]